MSLVAGGLLGPHFLTGGLSSAAVVATETFRHALHRHLTADDDLTVLVGNAIFPVSLPGTFDLAKDGPALTYTIFKFPNRFGHASGHHLGGSDGTVLARVRFGAWSYRYSEADAITVAIYDALDGVVNATWGTVAVMSCVHTQELDDAQPGVAPKSTIYHVVSEYDVRYRITIPSRS